MRTFKRDNRSLVLAQILLQTLPHMNVTHSNTSPVTAKYTNRIKLHYLLYLECLSLDESGNGRVKEIKMIQLHLINVSFTVK
jgi:hypothetical protein